jgi:hypothetical protein
VNSNGHRRKKEKEYRKQKAESRKQKIKYQRWCGGIQRVTVTLLRCHYVEEVERFGRAIAGGRSEFCSLPSRGLCTILHLISCDHTSAATTMWQSELSHEGERASVVELALHSGSTTQRLRYTFRDGEPETCSTKQTSGGCISLRDGETGGWTVK